MPKVPAPASAIFIFFSCRPLLQNQVTDRRVRSRYMVKAVGDSGLGTTSHIGHGTPRDQPHHHLNPLRAGFAYVVDMRQLCQPGRVGDQAVQKGVVEFLVDQPRTRALQLVAHATGAPDLDIERLFVLLQSARDGTPQIETAPPRWNRVLNDVHSLRNHRTRPGLRLTAQKAQRHGEAVVHIHLVDDG